MDINDIVTKKSDNPEEGINGYILNFASGGLSLPELERLQSLVDKVKHDGIRCADIGVAKGSSSAAMGFKAKELNGMVYSVDDYSGWKIHEDQWAQAKCSDIFRLNMKVLGIEKYITLLEMKSEHAAKKFEDGFFDLVFLDASHRYQEVVKDINNWKPKVRKGGILCGHDCQLMTRDGTVDIRPWQDCSGETTGYDQVDFHWHVGVMLAVGDLLPNARVLPYTTIWWVQL